MFTDRMLTRIEGPTETGCLIWTGARKNGGYGYVQRNGGRALRMHRVVYEEFVERLEGRILHHTCGNKACLNPDHLEPVEDQADHWQRHNTELCKYGHNNWGRYPKSGWRYCRTCVNDAVNRRYHERKR